jgi:hypothetical protein
MSSYRGYIKDPWMAKAMEAMSKAKLEQWKKCAKCGGEATTVDCEGAFLFPVCNDCGINSLG